MSDDKKRQGNLFGVPLFVPSATPEGGDFVEHYEFPLKADPPVEVIIEGAIPIRLCSCPGGAGGSGQVPHDPGCAVAVEFNAPKAAAAREAAIAQVDENASEQWKKIALLAIRAIVAVQETLTSDDVWARLPAGCRPHEPKALGAVMRQAQKLGIIVPLDEWRLSTRVACHRRPLRVWRRV